MFRWCSTNVEKMLCPACHQNQIRPQHYSCIKHRLKKGKLMNRDRDIMLMLCYVVSEGSL